MEEKDKNLSTTARSDKEMKENDLDQEKNKELLEDEEIVDLLKK